MPNPGIEAYIQRYDRKPSITGFPAQGTPAIDTGIWSPDFVKALAFPVVVWASGMEPDSVRYHHTGFTYPDRAAFNAATTGQDLIANQLVTPAAVHHRRYLPQPAPDGRHAYVEHHIVGDEGDGVRGVHFDFVVPKDTQRFLDFVQDVVTDHPILRGRAQVVTKAFPGGDAPVAKVGLQSVDNPNVEVAVMARTHWSDPKNW